jgi:NDP-sugar pyrophosphorylase family protein
MKAMVLAAGLGTRLQPLTADRPKALLEIEGRTLLEMTFARLRGFGIREAIVNVHHFADMIVEYLKANSNFGMRLEVSREDVLLDTGGGLKKAAWFFLGDPTERNQPFLLHNVDVLSTIDLNLMLQFHIEHGALATLAVQERTSSRYLLFDEQLQLCGRRLERDQTTEVARPFQKAQALAFSGIHVISPRLFALMTEDGAFSIIDTYLRLAAQQERLLAFRADRYYWRDLGTPESVRQAAEDLKRGVLSQ